MSGNKTSMKILWLNPWFGNYRVPVYRYLKEYSNDNFYLIYGSYSLSESLCNKLEQTLGDKAIAIDNSKRIVIGSEKAIWPTDAYASLFQAASMAK